MNKETPRKTKGPRTPRQRGALWCVMDYCEGIPVATHAELIGDRLPKDMSENELHEFRMGYLDEADRRFPLKCPSQRHSAPRRFNLVRSEDETGVSGAGIVAEGVEFADGGCTMRWRTSTKSTAVYDSMTDLIKIHGHGGRTKAVYMDEPGGPGKQPWGPCPKEKE